MKCRHCQSKLELTFLDLGSAPPSNAYLTAEKLQHPEKWYPLKVMVCKSCWLVQTLDFTDAKELFDKDYAYFSGFSQSWLEHSRKYVAEVTDRFSLNSKSLVIEVAANDGYLLQYFQKDDIPSLGIEPTASTAAAARRKGIEIIEKFFGVALAKDLQSSGRQADLMVANNVLAHVPDINDFVSGFVRALKPTGIATFEFPHLMRLVRENQFDTIYHEHFSYLSLSAIDKIFSHNGLCVFDVQQLPTHGGSLRVFAQRKDSDQYPISSTVAEVLADEKRLGLRKVGYYSDFQSAANKIKDDFLSFLLEKKCDGKKVVGYGAAAKGNTLMNYAGVRPDLVKFVVDQNPAKQGKYMPGSRIPIVSADEIFKSKPDYVVIMPWNLRDEISRELSFIREWGGKYVVAVPTLEVFE